jgi:Ankyrin repeat
LPETADNGRNDEGGLSMAQRHFPVRPNLEQLKHQAKDMLKAIRAGEPDALEDLRVFHSKTVAPGAAKLADAQHVLARSYGLPSWSRLVTACAMTDAIWRGDVEAVRAMVEREPSLMEEDARGVKGNWGPPLSYAANLGRDEIIEMLRTYGANDLEHAFGRACLQGKIETARRLHALMGNPQPPDDKLGWPAYTLNVEGTKLMLECGARLYDEEGRRLAPVDVLLETDSRKPEALHRILALYEEYGFKLPDTPVMAVYRGRIDLLEGHVKRDPSLLERTFAHEEFYPPELGCHDEVLATHGTPLKGATLLHLCMDYGEFEIAEWLLNQGMDVNARAAVDAEGFGGHTALFSAVVAQTNFWPNHSGTEDDTAMTRLLLEHGAEVNARASLRKELHPGYEIPGVHVYLDVTPLGWGRQFVFKDLVNSAALRMIEERGGVE